MPIAYFPILIALVTLGFAGFLVRSVRRTAPAKNAAAEFSGLVRQGARAYFFRHCRAAGPVAAVAVLLLLLWGWRMALGFAVGLGLSTAAVFLGTYATLRTVERAIEGAKRGHEHLLGAVMKGGMANGLLVVGGALLAISICYFFIGGLSPLAGVALGTSIPALFARIGGGIYAKAADMGADQAGKMEKGIPEDDPRNPALAADQVGDHVGGNAGGAADGFQTFLVALVAAMLLGGFLYPGQEVFALLPLFMANVAVLVSAAIAFLALLRASRLAARRNIGVSAAVIGLCLAPLILELMRSQPVNAAALWGCSVIGLAVAVAMMLAGEYYVSPKFRPVKAVARSFGSGHATGIVSGLGLGIRSAVLPALLIGAGALASFQMAGAYGVALAALSLSLLMLPALAANAYRPVIDNALALAKISQLPKEPFRSIEQVRSRNGAMKAAVVGYGIAAWMFALLALFLAYGQKASYLSGVSLPVSFSLSDPAVFAGLLIGGAATYAFLSFPIAAVGRTAAKIIAEARRQFKNITGLHEGSAKPEYAQCISIAAREAARETLAPALIPLLSPLFVGWLLGPAALGGFLAGAVITGFFCALSMTMSGSAWDAAKRLMESGRVDKRSAAYQAAITGDAVGDLYKDAAGPSLGPMLKTLGIVTLLAVVFLI